MHIQVVEELKPNEEENDEQMNMRVIMNREFTGQEITVARCAELSRLDEFKAKGDVYRAAVGGPLLS
eukprot:1539539-Pyramimonas_sp.AAC.1